MYRFSAMRSNLCQTAYLFVTLLASFSFLPALAQRPYITYILKSNVFRMATAAAAECQRSFEELKEKF
jgi:hypothetical protein